MNNFKNYTLNFIHDRKTLEHQDHPARESYPDCTEKIDRDAGDQIVRLFFVQN